MGNVSMRNKGILTAIILAVVAVAAAGADGAVLYLNGGNDLAGPLSRVQGAGGQVLVEKTKINDEIGFFGLFLDTEGNRIGLHSSS